MEKPSQYATGRLPLRNADRVVCWFSCGATSAVATKMALEKYSETLPVVVAYCDTGSEHPDNHRFLLDCQEWYGQPIEILRSKKYASTWDVFEKTRYIVGVKGARCTYELKTKPRLDFEQVDTDIQVFGFDSAERARADRYQANYPEVALQCPLLDKGLSKNDCKDILLRAGIKLPEIYDYLPNANCIGCVKAQGGYWNQIRKYFPDTFNRMAKLERDIGAAINKSYSTGERVPMYLDEMPEDFGRFEKPQPVQCGLFCDDALEGVNNGEA